jgi:microsomal prostaglandin-E synthase 2
MLTHSQARLITRGGSAARSMTSLHLASRRTPSAAVAAVASFLAVSAASSRNASTAPPAARAARAPAVGVPSPAFVVLYQYLTCPFCNKVRAYLDAVGVPYVVVEVEPLRKGELAWSAYKKVPTAVVNGVQINGSDDIIDAVDTLLAQGPRVPGAPTPARSGSAAEAKWRAWTDEVLVKHLTINLYRTLGESVDTFDYLTRQNFSPLTAVPAKYFGAGAMYVVARKRRTQLGVAPGAERETLASVLNEFADAVGEGCPFLGGAVPDLGDLAVFGAIRSVEDTGTGAAALASRIAPWYSRMRTAVGPSAIMHRVGEAPA